MVDKRDMEWFFITSSITECRRHTVKLSGGLVKPQRKEYSFLQCIMNFYNFLAKEVVKVIFGKFKR